MPVPLQFSRYVESPDHQKLHPGQVLPPSQPTPAASDSERVITISTRYPPSVSTDRPGSGSDQIWVCLFANTGSTPSSTYAVNTYTKFKEDTLIDIIIIH